MALYTATALPSLTTIQAVAVRRSDGKYLLQTTGEVETYNGAHLANYYHLGVENGLPGLYTFTFGPDVDLCPIDFDVIIVDSSTGDLIGVGELSLGEDGSVVTIGVLVGMIASFLLAVMLGCAHITDVALYAATISTTLC